jgi:anti-anti-sigma regulatory factor
MKNTADSVWKTITWWRELQEKIWESRLGSATVQEIKGSMVVSIAGNCTRENFVELACYISQHGGSHGSKIILDFTQMKSYDSPGMRALIGHFTRGVAEWGERVCLVGAPLEARDVLDYLDPRKRTRSAATVQDALDQLERLEAHHGPEADLPYAIIRGLSVDSQVAAM